MDSTILSAFAFCFAAGMSWLLLQRRCAFFWAALAVSLVSLGGYVFYLVPVMERLSGGDAVGLAVYLVLAAAVLLALGGLLRRRYRKAPSLANGFLVVVVMICLSQMMILLPERMVLKNALEALQMYRPQY